jgi:hypothetical protein
MFSRRAPARTNHHHLRRVLTIPLTVGLAALVAAVLLGAPGDEGARLQQITSAGATPAAACDEATLRAAIADSEAVAPDMVYEVTYLRCAHGFGWARISSGGEGVTIFLRISDAGMTLLDLGSGVCVAESGIPADVVPQIAPPRPDPALDCEAVAPTPIETEADFTG